MPYTCGCGLCFYMDIGAIMKYINERTGLTVLATILLIMAVTAVDFYYSLLDVLLMFGVLYVLKLKIQEKFFKYPFVEEGGDEN